MTEEAGGVLHRAGGGAYDALYRAYAPPAGRLVRLLLRMGCEREEACDIAQEALARLADRFDDVPNPEAWVTKTATNLYLSHCRRLRVRARRARALTVDGSGGDHGPAVADRMAVAIGLSRLKPIHRAFIVLRYFEDYRLRDIAEVLGKPEGTVKYLGVQAESALRRAMGGQV